jgi:hypothetical protein
LTLRGEKSFGDNRPIADVPLGHHTPSMNPLLKRLVGLIPITVGIAASWYFTWPKTQQPDNMWCVLQAPKGNQARSFRGLGNGIKAVRISGLAKKAKMHNLYNFKGQALISAATKDVSGSVDGSIFTDKTKQPNGLLLWITTSAIGSDQLSIATLNEGGAPDFSASQAFLHIGPNLGVSDRLSYPVAMRCRAKINE